MAREVCKMGVLQQKDTAAKSFFAKVNHKKHIYLPEKVYVFCIHDDRVPFLELYGSEKEVERHLPQKLVDLIKCSFISRALEDDRSFVIGFEDDKRNPLELTALTNQQREEWVNMLTLKLPMLNCLPIGTNEYGPLPFQVAKNRYNDNNGLQSTDSDDNEEDGGMLTGGNSSITIIDSGPYYQPIFSNSQRSSNAEEQLMYEPIVGLSSIGQEPTSSNMNIVRTTNPNIREEIVSTNNSSLCRQKSLPAPSLPDRPTKLIPNLHSNGTTTDRDEHRSHDTPNQNDRYQTLHFENRSDSNSEHDPYKVLTFNSPRVSSSSLPATPGVWNNNFPTNSTVQFKTSHTGEIHYENVPRFVTKPMTSSNGGAPGYNVFIGPPKPVVARQNCTKRPSNQRPYFNDREPLTPVEENSPILEDQDDRDVEEQRVEDQEDDRAEVPMAPLCPPPVPPRNGVHLERAPMLPFNRGGLVKVKANEVLKLSNEIESESGIKICLSMEAAIKGLALVEFKGNIWVAGWHVKFNSTLSPGFHIGDKLISIDNRPVPNTLENTKRLLGVLAFAGPIEVVVKRLPYGRTFLLERNVEGEDLGFIRKKGKNEIIDIEPNSSASKADFPLKTVSYLNPSSTVNWFLTEINGRPLNFFSKNNEAGQRLAAIGLETSIVVQPVDFVKLLKKTLKQQTKNYKEYVLG